VAVCCRRDSVSSRMLVASRRFSSAAGSRMRLTRAAALVAVERALRAGVRRFGGLRDKGHLLGGEWPMRVGGAVAKAMAGFLTCPPNPPT
jgi:hypothetical protein